MTSVAKETRVLLVDTSPEFLSVMRDGLVSRHFLVECAASGSQALAALGGQDFDVVVLDADMPQADGYRLFYILREYHAHTQIVMLTSDGNIQKAIELGKHGVFQHIGKACEIDQLAEVLHRAKAELERHNQNGARIEPACRESAPIRVLLVDDDEAFLVPTSRLLAHRGMQVASVTDGEAALAYVTQEPVDVAVLDLKMPGMDGLELLNRFKGIRPTMEVLLLTGSISVDSALEGLRLGAFDCLRKPQYPDDLVRAIQAAASRKKE